MSDVVRRMAGVTDKSYLFDLCRCRWLRKDAARRASSWWRSCGRNPSISSALCDEMILHYRNLLLAGMYRAVHRSAGRCESGRRARSGIWRLRFQSSSVNDAVRAIHRSYVVRWTRWGRGPTRASSWKSRCSSCARMRRISRRFILLFRSPLLLCLPPRSRLRRLLSLRRERS